MIDRTEEFQRIIAEQQARRQLTAGSNARPPAEPPPRSEFTAASAEIGKAVAVTQDKLAKLQQLAQSKSLFEDPTVEINELTLIIKQDITELNSKLAELQRLATVEAARGKKQRADHTAAVVEALKARLVGATREFHQILQTRSQNIELLQSRRDQFSGGSTPGCSSGGGASGGGGGDGAPGSAASSAAAGASGTGAPSGGGGGGGGAFGGGAARPTTPAAPEPVFELVAAPTPEGNGAGGASSEGGGAAWATPGARPVGLVQRRGMGVGAGGDPSDGSVSIDIASSPAQLQQQARNHH